MAAVKRQIELCVPQVTCTAPISCRVPSMKFASLTITFQFVLTGYKKIKKVKAKELHISMNVEQKREKKKRDI